MRWNDLIIGSLARTTGRRSLDRLVRPSLSDVQAPSLRSGPPQPALPRIAAFVPPPFAPRRDIVSRATLGGRSLQKQPDRFAFRHPRHRWVARFRRPPKPLPFAR